MQHLKKYSSILEKHSNPFLGMLPNDVVTKVKSGEYGEYNAYDFFYFNKTIPGDLAEYIVGNSSSFNDIIKFLNNFRTTDWQENLRYQSDIVREVMLLYATSNFDIDMLKQLYNKFNNNSADSYHTTSIEGKQLRQVLLYNKRHSLENLETVVKFFKDSGTHFSSSQLKEINPAIDWTKTENYKSLIKNWKFEDITTDRIKKNNNLDLRYKKNAGENYRFYNDGVIRYIPATGEGRFGTSSPRIVKSTGIIIDSEDTANEMLGIFIKYLYRASLALIKDNFKSLPLEVRKLRPKQKTATIKDYEIFWSAALKSNPELIAKVKDKIDTSLVNKSIWVANDLGLF